MFLMETITDYNEHILFHKIENRKCRSHHRFMFNLNIFHSFRCSSKSIDLLINMFRDEMIAINWYMHSLKRATQNDLKPVGPIQTIPFESMMMMMMMMMNHNTQTIYLGDFFPIWMKRSSVLFNRTTLIDVSSRSLSCARSVGLVGRFVANTTSPSNSNKKAKQIETNQS